MRLFAVVLAFAVFAMAFSGTGNAITTGNCADGTAYGKCSSVNPGNYCIGSISAPTLGVLVSVCPCEKYPGWITQGTGDGATCVQAKCDDNTKAGDCSTTKPKVCIGGSSYADNATKCGCPTGKRASSNGIYCEFIPCSDGGVSVPEGTCSPKKAKKCTGGQLVDKASECGCPVGQVAFGESCAAVCSDAGNNVKEGMCASTKPKKCVNGYLVDAADSCGCPEGQTAVGKRCSSAIGSIGTGVDLLGGTGTNGTGAAGTAGASPGASPLSCCCLPTALIGIIGGFVLFRKNE